MVHRFAPSSPVMGSPGNGFRAVVLPHGFIRHHRVLRDDVDGGGFLQRMTAKWDFDCEYHIGRINGGFYIIDDKGNTLEGPFHRLEFAHVGFAKSDHIKAWGEEGMEMLTKDGLEYAFPSNLTMDIKIGDNE